MNILLHFRSFICINHYCLLTWWSCGWGLKYNAFLQENYFIDSSNIPFLNCIHYQALCTYSTVSCTYCIYFRFGTSSGSAELQRDISVLSSSSWLLLNEVYFRWVFWGVGSFRRRFQKNKSNNRMYIELL